MKNMRIDYECNDGSRTSAMWPSMALLHWNMRFRPRATIENPRMFELYIVGPPMPGDTDPRFLALVYATLEREFNKTPPFEIVHPDGTEDGGAVYQQRCLEVLTWLASEGHIGNLTIRESQSGGRG